MACYSPLRAVLQDGPNGRRISFKMRAAGTGLSLPCGRCIGCRLERARQWAVRLMHEAKMHEESCFITLTYAPEHLPEGGTLSVEHCQLFLKRLRARLAPKRIRFFLCGEYGEKLERPHYHAILFGHDFEDKILLESSGEHREYTSPLLAETWGKGGVHLGSVSFESACYVANYATKKITGKKAAEHYAGRKPEFVLMSRGGRKAGGIGRSFIEKFKSDVYPSDEVIVRGMPARPPRYYDQVVEAGSPGSLEGVKAKRVREAEKLETMVLRSGARIEVAPSANLRRLKVREKVAQAKAALKIRKLEKS